MRITKIEYRGCLEYLGREATEDDLQKWIGYLGRRLKEKYPDAYIKKGVSEFVHGSQLFVSCEDDGDEEEAKEEIRNFIRQIRDREDWEEGGQS